MHEHGIPERSDWPEGVLDAVAQFRQGDLAESLPLFYWAAPRRAVHARTRFYADQEHLDDTVVRFAEPAPYGIVTTQTCDLAQEGAGRPNSAWVRLAPVFDAESPHPSDSERRLLRGDARKLLMQGRDQFRLWLPNHPREGTWFADLSFEVSVERGWLASRDPMVVLVNDDARADFATRLAWLAARPAFDSRFVAAVQQPVIEALRELRRTNLPAYERMHEQVAELGITLDARLAVGQAELSVLHLGLDDDLDTWWRQLWVKLKAKADGQDFNLLPLRVAHLDELSARDYRSLTRLPLASISPHPAWYGSEPEALP